MILPKVIEMLPLLFILAVPDTVEIVHIPVAHAESLAVTVQGTGQPVVLIPGLFGSSFGYRHVMASLAAAGYRAVGVEPLGMGISSRPRDADYSLTAQADRVAAVLDSLSISGAVFVGHSLGASIAMRVAYRRSDLVRGIVSIEGGPGETATTDGFRRWMRFAPVARMLDARRIMQQMLYREMQELSYDGSWVDRDIVRSYTAGLVADYRATIGAYQQMARSEEPERLGDHLAQIACPVALLIGEVEHDSGPQPAEVQLLSDRLASFVVDTVQRSGYFIQEEQPVAVVDAVQSIDGVMDCNGLN